MMKILMADSFDDTLPARLAAFGTVSADLNDLGNAQVLLVRSKTKVTREMLDKAPQLKLVIRGGVGLDNVDIEACRARGIEVRNTPRASSVAVAELALALMLAVPNRVVEGHEGMKAGQWLKKELKRTELFGKTLGLLGVGLIGTEVARRALAFGMRVVAHDHYVPHHALAEMLDTEEDLFAVADYISIHLPLTPETKGMIDARALSQMKDGVVIVNTARGKVVVEEDLAGALKAGKVRAYATDVWASDPPDPASPLLSAPNVLMTPHIGASSKENLLRIGDAIVEILTKRKVTAGV
jgi:D-3-phosphoglycerate dehydrogenase